MKHSNTVEWLAHAVKQATRSTTFCVAGSLPDVNPGIKVEGLGVLKLPLKRTTAAALVAACQTAPYGQGAQTLVDKKVRNTLQLDAKKLLLSEAWNTAIAAATQEAAKGLGLPAEQLEARLYKMLVYEKGGFFLPHRDSEKHDRMVASMVVVLPNPFEGGGLIVRHGSALQKFTFDDAAHGKAACYAAFYADCEHEVERVTRGLRLCLAYNLVLQPTRGKRSNTTEPADPSDKLAESIASWIATQPAQPLVFALEHHYTQRGLSVDLLKGADRQLANLVVSAAAAADCHVHLAQVSRHLLQFADDGSMADSHWGRRRHIRHALEIGETYEDELIGMEWTDVEGTKQPWGKIPLQVSAIVAAAPIDEWQPTSETFEGYTGNEGNTLDRWYHRSALVVWHEDHHFDVIASAGVGEGIPMFLAMAAKLAKTPKTRIGIARNDCICFARSLIAQWPRRQLDYDAASAHSAVYNDFRKQLLTLHDAETVAAFLAKMATHDRELNLSAFVVDACREFGWGAFARELKQLLSSGADRHSVQEVPYRDMEWLAAFCCDEADDKDKLALARELCALAAARFCQKPPERNYYFASEDRKASIAELSLPLLLKALVAAGCDDDLASVLHFVRAAPDQFRMDQCQVPSLKTLIPWSQKQFGQVHPELVSWLAAVRQHLETATAKEPAPPADWTRPAEVACQCEYCAQLKTFLSDPTLKADSIPAREDMRQHLIGKINRHRCDVEHTLERKGSPYSLRLTKTNGSFQRAAARFKADCRLLKELPPPV